MQSVSSRIWTRVAVSISSDDNNYTTGTSIILIESSALFSDWLPNPLKSFFYWSFRGKCYKVEHDVSKFIGLWIASLNCFPHSVQLTLVFCSKDKIWNKALAWNNLNWRQFIHLILNNYDKNLILISLQCCMNENVELYTMFFWYEIR